MNIGFVGVGSMGEPMARMVIPHHDVTVYDPDPSRIAKLLDAGAHEADSPQAATIGADIVIVMVATPAQLDDALFGERGVDSGVGPNSLVMLMSTVGIPSVAAAGERLNRVGVGVVDAPVTGGVARAITGELTALIGASDDDLARVAPVLRLMASKLAHCGTRVGDGQAVKLVNQLLCSVHLTAAAEALTFASKLGLDPAKVLTMIESGAASSFMLSDRGPRMLADQPSHVLSAVDIFVKDSSLVLAAASQAGAYTPLIETSHAMFAQAAERGLGRWDDSSVIQVFEEKTQT